MLSLSDVSVNYGVIQAVRGVSLNVEEGEIVALLGPNGAGKTSLVSSVVGIVPVSGGRVTFKGEDITRVPVEGIVARGLTLTPEGRRVFAGLSVAENLRLGAATRKDPVATERDLNTYLDMFPILKERYHQTASTLSGGEQQMLAIARALMSAPTMLMLDEPSLGLAPRIVDRIFELMLEMKKSGLTMLVVEQNASEALAFSDRAYVLASGSVVYEGAAKDLAASDQLMEAYLGTGVA
ncbi:ABC transporter ATP-binding protein [Acuticoccus mangrovi]|uniref:ABC transporter ATP-binding protein n=1 Tax=Acuticoccus mangrovi TaxID=2796142 RepID=A0A934IL19_9HYPH|nr:ABC transporter ATP-binding protein [Acuticoccus mangrovi]MBJ3778473.1 ABC transporter ATP-binding protein [Acuticoccus mangrovi]